MRILYCGDSPAEGPARYLLAILKHLRAQVTHIPPGVSLHPSRLHQKYAAFILSDYSRRDMPLASEKLMAGQVRQGSGLLMVGGWGSFAGPFGKWKGSLIEKLLPVRCLSRDDRLNFPAGALLTRETRHPLLKGLPWNHPPAVCGINKVSLKRTARTLLSVRPIVSQGRSLRFQNKRYPLLVIDGGNPLRRTAALTTDLAPHWCAGLVDWGRRRRQLCARTHNWIEVGDAYVAFVQSLVRWLAGTL